MKTEPNGKNKEELERKMEDMEVINETIKFGDNTPPKDIQVRLTHFGPIITDAPAFDSDLKALDNKPLALKWVASSEKFDLLGAALAVDRATDWQTFRQALTGWAMPAQHFIFADIAGNIGSQFPGLR